MSIEIMALPAVNMIITEAEEMLYKATSVKMKLRVMLPPDSPESLQELQIQILRESVCKEWNVSWSAIMSKSRKREITEARFTYMYFRRIFFNISLKAIGKEVGDRDYTSVVYACEFVRDRLQTRDECGMRIINLLNQIKNETLFKGDLAAVAGIGEPAGTVPAEPGSNEQTGSNSGKSDAEAVSENEGKNNTAGAQELQL